MIAREVSSNNATPYRYSPYKVQLPKEISVYLSPLRWQLEIWPQRPRYFAAIIAVHCRGVDMSVGGNKSVGSDMSVGGGDTVGGGQ